MKKLLPGLYIVIVLSLLLIGLSSRERLNSILLKSSITGNLQPTSIQKEESIDSAFNYSRNKQAFKITLLEFGASSCSECKKMEKVMQMVKTHYPQLVNVVFINVNLKENRQLIKHFNVGMIPEQVLLDQEANILYRHLGYLSFNELSIEINSRLMGL